MLNLHYEQLKAIVIFESKKKEGGGVEEKAPDESVNLKEQNP